MAERSTQSGRKKKRKRVRSNGLGCIRKLSGNRKNPWAVLITVGWDKNGKQLREYIGYAPTKTEAEELLADYIANKKSVIFKNILFKNLFNEWIATEEELQVRKNNGEPVKALSHKGLQRYRGVYNNYYAPLYNKIFTEITNCDIQQIVDSCTKGFSTKSDIKGLYNKLKDFLDSKQSTNTKYINIGTEVKSTKHIPFTEEEIKLLWENKNYGYIEAILINIYTGLRPSEILKIKEINLEERYMIGGIKTEAGIDRIIPIHEKIVPLIEKWLISGKLNISYPTYRTHFLEAMDYLGMKHTPHDCRHTNATLLDRYNANPICIKLILGHQNNDITEGTYTHKSLSELLQAINLITI